MAGNPYDGRTLEELHAERERLQAIPKNRNPPGSFYLYTAPTRRKLDQIAWAVTHLMAERRAAAPAEETTR